jgi:glutamate-1-semialdehyde aminotransferase
MTNKELDTVAHTHTNLNVFAAVLQLMEAGLIYGGETIGSLEAADEIIQICKAEQRRLVRKYDAARAALVQKDQGHE